MSHLLTGIPVGSRVVCLAMKRFPQEKFSARTGAIRIEATQFAYPIMIQVRPGGGAVSRTPTGLRNFGPVEYATQRPMVSGDVIDFVLRGPQDKKEPDSHDYWQTRHSGRVMMKIVEVQAGHSPETDIYDRIFCVTCGENLVSEVGKSCRSCVPQDDPLCTAMRRTDAGPMECRDLRHPGLEVCRTHAEEAGLIEKPKPAPPPADRCVWSGCESARYKQYVMCAEHAIESGIVGGVQPETREVKAKPVKAAKTTATGGSFGRHRPDCECRICSGRRAKRANDTAEIIAAHDEVETVTPAEEPVVLSGVDSIEGDQ